ncbi:rhodanese-like domain-containing protein [Tenacibaculum amylolyticum]|uniref:rhodanese-like domain-containing protein n=1 Tax=Tenacibaculum amylolyticum TaxID=104269 RepID=UPI0038936074
MKKLLSIFIIAITLFNCKTEENSHIQTLSLNEFEKAIQIENVQLIDVRTPEEYADGHIENAAVINYFGDDFKEKAQQLDKNKPVYLYCKSGKRSAKASKVLGELGFTKIYDLQGGYNAWSNK